MGDQLTTQQLLQAMRAARLSWEALLNEAGDRRLTEPGVEGEWSLKDIIGHIAYFETWVVTVLSALQRGERWPRAEYAGLEVDEENALIYERNRAKPLDQVLQDSQTSFQRSLEAVAGMRDEDLYDLEFTRAVGADCTVFDLIAGDTFEHYYDHGSSVRAWLDRVATH